MPLQQDDATRILRFCLAAGASGTALRDERGCVVKISRPAAGGAVESFELTGRSFEAALREAAAAGVVKATCIEKQIAFLSRSLAAAEAAGLAGGHTPLLGILGAPDRDDGPCGRDGIVRRAHARALLEAVSALVHALEDERDHSIVHLALRRAEDTRRLTAVRRRVDRRRLELGDTWQARAELLPAVVRMELDRARGRLEGALSRRSDVEDLRVNPATVAAEYGAATSRLVATFEAIAMAEEREADVVWSRLARTWALLLNAEERACRARGHLAPVFARGLFEPDEQHAELLRLIAERQSYLHAFTLTAPPGLADLYRVRRETELGTLARAGGMEQAAVRRRIAASEDGVETWFSAMSAHIEVLRELEVACASGAETW